MHYWEKKTKLGKIKGLLKNAIVKSRERVGTIGRAALAEIQSLD